MKDPLYVQFLDAGFGIKEFNSESITLVPKSAPNFSSLLEAKRYKVLRKKSRDGVLFVLSDTRFNRLVNLVWHGDDGRDKAKRYAYDLELRSNVDRPLVPLTVY